jgi:hypothetical protein
MTLPHLNHTFDDKNSPSNDKIAAAANWQEFCWRSAG